MLKSQRSIVLLSMLKLSERELKDLHQLTNEIHFTSFIELIRDTEDEIMSSASLPISFWNHSRPTKRFENESFYKEIDQFRKYKLKMPVSAFSEALTMEIKKESKNITFPKFDSRRGLRVWLAKLIRIFGEGDVFHFAMKIRHENHDNQGADWRLR